MRDSIRKRNFVTGAPGLFGSHLCEWLLTDSHGVLCVDNFFTGPVNLGNPRWELKVQHEHGLTATIRFLKNYC